MSILNAMNISASGMTAQRLRMDVIASNVANVNTTRNEDGETYKRKLLVFSEKNSTPFERILNSKTGAIVGSGVKVTHIAEDDKTPMKVVYDPSHPDANEEGYVTLPNIDTVTEMTNLISASRAFEANVTAFNATKNMALKALDIGK